GRSRLGPPCSALLTGRFRTLYVLIARNSCPPGGGYNSAQERFTIRQMVLLNTIWEVGACTRIRTRDQLIKSQLLYQLSYAGAPVIVLAESSAACRRNHGRPSALLSKLLSNGKTVVKFEGAERGKLLSFWAHLGRQGRSGVG